MTVSFIKFSSVFAFVSALSVLGLSVQGCSSSDDGDSEGATGGQVVGPISTRCTATDGSKIVQPTSADACMSSAHHEEETDGATEGLLDLDTADDKVPFAHEGHEHGGSDGAGGEEGDSDYGDTLFNAEGDDDECKYHVSWTSTPVTQSKQVTFTVKVTSLVDGSAVTGAAPRAEVYLNETHPAPSVDKPSVEISPGEYTVGPVQFDASGQWTVRFHFFETCGDDAMSPHGHAAFYVSVP